MGVRENHGPRVFQDDNDKAGPETYFLWNTKFITVFTTAYHCSMS